MRMSYTMAQAMTIAAFIPCWLPTIMGWPVTDIRAIISFTTAIALIVIPFVWAKYGPGMKL